MRAFVKEVSKILLLVFLAGVVIAMCRTCDAAQSAVPAQYSRPDPFIRMTSPSGCSGGVIHASREHGIWIATCRHCVARSGSPVTVYFFWNGHRSPAVRGTCYRAHPRYDCSVVVVPPAALPVLPTVTELAGPEIGPRPGQTVYSIGSYAGGTYQPAVQKMAVTALKRHGYEFTLNDSAWGGHSGGPVLDAATHKLLGVLWGAGRNYSIVTANRAIWEVLLGRSLEAQPKKERWVGSSQAFFSVSDPIDERPVVHVYGTAGDLEEFLEDWRSTPCLQRIEWRFHDPHEERSNRELHFVWKDENGKGWYVDGWPGAKTFLSRLGQVGFAVRYGDCPDCPGGRSPVNPWQTPPTPPRGPWGGSGQAPFPPEGNGGAEQDERLKNRIEELQEQIEALEKQAQAAEEAARQKQLELQKQQFQHELEKLRLQSRGSQPRSGEPHPGEAAGAASTADLVEQAVTQFHAERREVERTANVLQSLAGDAPQRSESQFRVLYGLLALLIVVVVAAAFVVARKK